MSSSFVRRFAIAGVLAAVAAGPSCTNFGSREAPAQSRSVKIGNYFSDAPYGIAIIVDDETGFLIDPDWDGKGQRSRYYDRDVAFVPPGTASPDFSYVRTTFLHAGANITFTWGRSGPGAVVALIGTDRPAILSLRLPATWPRFHTIYTASADGLTGYGIAPRGAYVPFVLRVDPAPSVVRANVKSEAEVVLDLDPRRPARFVAGIGELPDLGAVEGLLRTAGESYAARRIAAEGSWGDFLGAIADNANFSRLYGSDNGRTAHSDGRGWWLQKLGGSPDHFPYFVWDFFFNALLASLEDPEGAHDTVRAVLSFQTPEGFVPSFSHWNNEDGTYVTLHRSMPPVGAMCVWKMHTRRPDRGFLAEVYPALARWHAWWPEARDGNRNGLLEWGSGQGWWQGAQYETGWDDNVHFERTAIVGQTMNADAVDLSSLWAMDAEYLSFIAAALGKNEDADRFRREREEMNKRINDRLWNESLGIYCSRLWDIPAEEAPALPANAGFRGGFEGVFYRDWLFRTEAARRRADRLDFDWGDAGPMEGIGGDRWAARWSGTFSPPEPGSYRFAVQADEGARLFVDGKLVLDSWTRTTGDRRTADIDCGDGKPRPVVLEYFEDKGRASLRFVVHRLMPGKPGSDWLTRLTPMNFYPLICGAPDADRAKRVLDWMYRKDKFWGAWILPTVPYDDPVWSQQTYWRGHIWPPANYLLWQGMRRYADASRQAEFARKSVDLFMRNWTTSRLCCENYRSSDGACGDDPHYTWGALLCLIGVEALADVGPDFKPVPRRDLGLEDIVMRRVPFGGGLYRIEIGRGTVSASPEPDR